MKFYNFFIILLAVIFISSIGTTKDTEDTQSKEYSSVAKDVNDSAEKPKKFNYNETYGPAPLFSIGGGFAIAPGGYNLDTKLDIPYKDDLYIGPHVYYSSSSDETNFGITGNVKKILESEDPKFIPSIEAGVGILVRDEDNNNDDNSSYFLFQIGAGVDRVISDNLSVGIHLYNNYGTDFDDSTHHLALVAGLQIRLY